MTPHIIRKPAVTSGAASLDHSLARRAWITRSRLGAFVSCSRFGLVSLGLVPVLVLAAVLGPSAALHGATLWREGERPDESQVKDHSWYNSVQNDLLSGGAWLSNFGSTAGTATYHLQIPEDGQYAVWIRANPTSARLSWNMHGGQWQEASMQEAQHRVNVAEGGAVDIRHVGWVRLALLDLDQGRHTLRIKLHSNNKNHGAIDAIFLNNEGLVPVGKGNPAIEGEKHAEGFFAWSPGVDPLDGSSPIDLRQYNEEVAGVSGFVQRSGDHFELGNGQTVRFWMVQGGLGNDPSTYDRRARRLAKYGVNMVRMGGGNFFRNWRHDKPAFHKDLEDFHRKVAALKKQGIYTYIDHLYWHTHHPIDETVFPGFGDGHNAIALMFFSEKFQNLYLDFLNDLMTRENPHTGLSMAADAAVAIVEVHNESSLLFYTFKPADFPETERQLVEQKFGNWLREKYGSLDQALAAWGDKPRRGNPTADEFAQGRAGLYDAARLSGESWAQNSRNQRRAADQLEFMIESQKRFYERMSREMRERIGMGQLIAPSNWKTADPRVLDGLERYTYTGADMVCRNSYFGVDYAPKGQQRFYEIEVGDTYRYHSSLKATGRPSPLGTPLVAGFPFMVTENNWTRPNRYRVEWPLLVATYAQMMGVDGWTFFAKEDTDWRHSMGVWDVSNPSVLGQFPAAALMFRRGDVRQPDVPAVAEYVNLEQAYQMQGTQAVPLRGEDALWQAKLGDLENSAADDQAGINPLAYFVGPVLQQFGNERSRVRSVDLDQYIDVDQQTVHSMTRQLYWDAGRGVMKVDTQQAQGAWGFLKDAGVIRLGDITIRSGNDYGAVLAVSLDGKPLASSSQILIQTGSWDRPYGFETEPAGQYEKITKLGGYPLNVRQIDAEIMFARQFDEAQILDGNGYVTERNAGLTQTEAGTLIELPQDSLYTIVR